MGARVSDSARRYGERDIANAIARSRRLGRGVPANEAIHYSKNVPAFERKWIKSENTDLYFTKGRVCDPYRVS